MGYEPAISDMARRYVSGYTTSAYNYPGWDRTSVCRSQNPLPYRLAIPQYGAGIFISLFLLLNENQIPVLLINQVLLLKVLIYRIVPATTSNHRWFEVHLNN